MSNSVEWVNNWRDNANYLNENGLYRHEDEHSSCGVGLVAAIDGKPSRDVVLRSIEALQVLWHRGAIDADGKTGDGAGIHLQIPQQFFKDYIHHNIKRSVDSDVAVGMVFLPRTDMSAQEKARTIIEHEIIAAGYHIYGWRQVPVNRRVIGSKAEATRPEIEQVLIGNKANNSEQDFEAGLYITRRRIEKLLLQETLLDAYICSFSCRSVIYKGLFQAEQLSAFYPDLNDDKFISNFAIYHQRYSTNTFPAWALAQPFRVLSHNGEINTISGNSNWMRCHESLLDFEAVHHSVDDIKPIIQPNASDSSALDNAYELMLRTGRVLPEVQGLMMPQAWEGDKNLPQNIRDFYHYNATLMEPWDGPASICAYGGKWVIGALDRNGLRPLRYTICNGLLVVGSEAGMVRFKESEIEQRGKLGPGEMIAVNLKDGGLLFDSEVKNMVADKHPYHEWVSHIVDEQKLAFASAKTNTSLNSDSLRQRQLLAGWTMEELELILHPMMTQGKEATGSMGDDSPLAVLSEKYRGLHQFIRQNFSQVTNPPIDSLRERQMMSLKTRIGNLSNILNADSEHAAHVVELESPILTNGEFTQLQQHYQKSHVFIDCCFDVRDDADENLAQALSRVASQAEDAVRSDCKFIILDDSNINDKRAPIPMILAVGNVHTHLISQGLRTYTSINVRCGQTLDTHQHAVLIGVGATTVNAYMAQESLINRYQQLHKKGLCGDISLEKALANYKKSIGDGLLKIMSKMGISIVSSYRGGCNFEAIGLSRSLVHAFFPSMTSRMSGLGLSGIEKAIIVQHQKAFDQQVSYLPSGGFYRYRHHNNGDQHAWQARMIHILQDAVHRDSFSTYMKYAEMIREQSPVNIRDLLDFDSKRQPLAHEDVESVTQLRKRLVAPGISLGALSPIAHETLSIAMNRIGAKSDSGEGGEDPIRYIPKENGDNACSTIKQVASGRFGVTAEYLNNCSEIEIKMAQGAKPGEGGQLPGFKVSEVIAKLRHSTEGVTLISPPPHHDIYSIEDLAQLIYDLKQINPNARVCVKLVARSGIGTIAAGVAKAHADTILISGHSGGTGASPQTSIKYAGLPWEMGLSEAHQVLSLNNLRHRVVLRTDGGIKTGRDVVIAAILGAEEFGIGTAALVAMGCIMVRQCHSNTCPVGVCTQDSKLIDKFTGTADKVVNLFTFIAEEARQILADLGFSSLDEVIGRTDLLTQISRGSDLLDDLDLNPLLTRVNGNDDDVMAYSDKIKQRNEVAPSLDEEIVNDAVALFERREKLQLQYNVKNTDRAIGTRVSAHITRKFGMKTLAKDQLTIKMRGSAGQSLGAFAVQGLKLEVAGEANDYVGKGLSGGEIIIRPTTNSKLEACENVIIGNTCLYGATAGRLFAAGRAGERFAVRNSGAQTVIEGCGAHGCEYMTGGEVLILGDVGVNFAAGMTGGMAFIYDKNQSLHDNSNHESIGIYALEDEHWCNHVKNMLTEHINATSSILAQRILQHWDDEISHFCHVIPNEIIGKIAHAPQQQREKLLAKSL